MSARDERELAGLQPSPRRRGRGLHISRAGGLLPRRRFLFEASAGLGSIALADLLAREAKCAEPTAKSDPVAKHVIFLFMSGGPSQVDTFDPKPALQKYNGKDAPEDIQSKLGTSASTGRPLKILQASPYGIETFGNNGIEIANGPFSHLARHIDDLCIVRSMTTTSSTHGSACLMMNTGATRIGNPSLGSWASYGLGSLNENLPSFVVLLDPRGGPHSGPANWSSGFLPAEHQGTRMLSSETPLLFLENPTGVDEKAQRRSLDILKELSGDPLAAPPIVESELEARIKSYELAYRMQTEVPRVFNLSGEKNKFDDYGIGPGKVTDDFGRRCLLAHRLVENGVRFVQLVSGSTDINANWDAHYDLKANHDKRALETDQPIAALLQDLKVSGLWKDTIVVWAGEFGRTPVGEGSSRIGRDHNPHGFSIWLAGGPIQGGRVIGATDDFGLSAIAPVFDLPKGEKKTGYTFRDLQATLLSALGLDPRKLDFRTRRFAPEEVREIPVGT